VKLNFYTQALVSVFVSFFVAGLVLLSLVLTDLVNTTDCKFFDATVLKLRFSLTKYPINRPMRMQEDRIT